MFSANKNPIPNLTGISLRIEVRPSPCRITSFHNFKAYGSLETPLIV